MNVVKWAVLFPGQGAQYVGMGRSLWETMAASRRVFNLADETLGFSLSEIVFDGPASRLTDTDVQQPAILTVSIAIWEALRQELPGRLPELGMGLSLGEYSAYVASGLFAFRDAVHVTRLRGQAMQEAVPRGLGGMTAVMGLDRASVEELCREAGEVEPANYNAPGQTVVSGMIAGLERLETLASSRGARWVRLPVSAPFHSRYLVAAGPVLSKALADVSFGSGRFPVLANIDTEPCTMPEQAVPRLIQQVSRPVRFEQSVRRAMAAGVTVFVELGPGRSLTSLIKKIDRHLTAVNVEDEQGLAKALELLQA